MSADEALVSQPNHGVNSEFPENESPEGVFAAFFGKAWDHIQDVHTYGHLDRLPLYCVGENWDESFAAAYDRIEPYLRPLSRLRPFPVPAGLRCHPRPIMASTAHEALMMFLNPSQGLYGEGPVLDSRQFVAIQAAAQDELAELGFFDHLNLPQSKRRIASNAGFSGDATTSSYSGKTALLLSFLLAHHSRDEYGKGRMPIGTQAEIARCLTRPKNKFNQCEVSKALKELLGDVKCFGDISPMGKYRRLCEAGKMREELEKLEFKTFKRLAVRTYGPDILEKLNRRTDQTSGDDRE